MGHTLSRLRVCVAMLASAVLASCSTPDGPPLVDPGFDPPDATPRVEPPSKYGNPSSYVVFGKRYYTMRSSDDFVERGIASWYGRKFHGRRTSSGERFDMFSMTAAHRRLPLPTYVRVTHLETGRSIVVRVNDRGPFHADRVIDLSYGAAKKLGILAKGTGRVEVRAIDPRRKAPIAGATPVRASTPSTESLGRHNGPAIAVPSSAAATPSRYYLQLGAFSHRQNAERFRGSLGLPASMPLSISPADGEDTTMFRVRVGPIENEDDVNNYVARIVELGLARPIVVKE